MQDNKRSTKGAKAQGERGRSRPGKAKTEQGGSVSQFTCEDEQIAAYYSAMMRVEDSMWKRWGRIRADLETREIQRAMFRALASLELMYQVRFVSLYIMFLMRSSWERVVLRLGRSFESRSSGYKGNILMISCMLISSNYEELEPPAYSSLVQAVLDYGFVMMDGERIARRHVHALERLAWELTDFQVELPSANSFLMQIVHNSTLPKTRKLRVSRLAQTTIRDSLCTHAVLDLRQSLIAVAAFGLAVSADYGPQSERSQFYLDQALRYSSYSRGQVAKAQTVLTNLRPD